MTPEQRIARQQKEAEADIRRAILGQETFHIKALEEGDGHSIVPDKAKFTRNIAVASWMDRINGKDNIPGTMDWQANKDALAQEYFKQDVRGISDDDFAGLVRDHVMTQAAFADVAFTAAAKETPLPEAIKEARDKSGLFGIGHKFAGNQGRYLADFTRQYADTKQKLFPYRDQINQLTEMGRASGATLPKREAGSLSGFGPFGAAARDFANRPLSAVMSDPLGAASALEELGDMQSAEELWQNMANVMLTIPAEDREDVLHAIAAQGKGEGETEKDAFTRTVQAWDRGLERYVMTSKEGLRDIGFTALMTLSAAEAAGAQTAGAMAGIDVKGPESFIRPEEEQQMDFLKRQMRELSRGSLDPLERVELLGINISGAAENLPMMATSFIPYVGPAMMLGSFKAETEYQLRQQYPEMDSATIEGFSMFAAPFQAASEVISDRLLFGRLPSLGRLINSPAFKSGAIVGQLAGRVGIGGTVEYTEELFQQAFPQVMVDLAEAMGADIPDVNWGDFWRDWKANQGELIATIIPLVLLGSGVGQFSDFQNSRALARNEDLLIAAGYSAENAAKIKEFADAGKWGEAQDFMMRDWRAVNAKGVSIPEVSNEAATKILAEREAAREKVLEKLQQVQGDVGRIAAQGGYSLSKVAGGWQVTTPDSQVTVQTAEEATALLQNHYNEAERENILAVAKLADEFEKQGDTQRVEIKPGEQVQIKWEDNQEAVEVAARMAGLTPEQAKRMAFNVLGNSKFEYVDGIKRAVSSIFQGGNVLTMVEETVEGRFKRALETGAMTREEATKMVQLAESIVNEGKTGKDVQTFLAKDAADQDRALIEAVSKIVYLDVFGRRKEGGRFTPGLISRGLKAAVQMQAPTEALAFQMQQAAQGKTAEASQMHAFLSAFRTLFGSVFKAARALKQARAQGKTEELDTFINKLIGVQAEVVEQEATFQEAQTLLAEMPQLEGQPYETFSLVPAETDAAYMDAVARGDMETAQKMVDEVTAKLGLDLSHRSDKPFNEKKKSSFVVMFVDKLDRVTNAQRNSGYGKNEILLRSSDLTEPPPWAIEWLTEQPEIQQQANFESSDPSLLAVSSMNPPDIIDGGGMWDNPELVSRFWSENEARLEKERIYGFKTPDGAVVFDPYSAPFVNAEPVIKDDAGNVIPLSQRFNAQRPEITYSMRPQVDDAAYMDALQGDNGNDNLTEQLRATSKADRQKVVNDWIARNPQSAATLQQRVNDAAKQAGAIEDALFLFHGGNKPKKSFEAGPSRSGIPNAAAYLTDTKRVAWKYAIGGGITEGMSLPDYRRKQLEQLPSRQPTVQKLFLFGNVADFYSWKDRITSEKLFKVFGEDRLRNTLEEFSSDARQMLEDGESVKSALEFALEEGGWVQEDTDATSGVPELQFVIASGLLEEYLQHYQIDIIAYDDAEAGGKTYVALNPNQIKSADPVTYDDAGNVIPLSQRFNPQRPEITYSVRPSFEDRLTGVFSPLMRDPVIRRELAQRALEKAKQQVKLMVEPATDKAKQAEFEALQEKLLSLDADYQAEVADIRQEREFELSGAKQEQADKLTLEKIKRDYDAKLATARQNNAVAKEKLRNDFEATAAGIDRKARMLAGLRVLNAALAAMPPVVRTRVGGFIAVAQRSTAKGMMDEIERRIKKLDVELEKYLADEATQEAEDLFDRYKSQRDKTGRQAGKIMASATEQIDYALGIYQMDDEQQDTVIGGLEKKIDESLDPDEQQDAIAKLGVASLFSHWDKQDSESRYTAVDWMRDIIETGKLGKNILDEERKQFLSALREDARKSVSGDIRASLADAENKDNQTDSSAWKSFVSRVKTAGGSLLWTSAQQIELLFGADSQVYKYFTDKIIEAANLSTDIKTAADQRRINLMQTLFNTKSSIKLAQAMARLQKARNSGVIINQGRVTEKVRIPVDKLQALSDGTIKPEDIGLNEAQAAQALEDFAASGPMKRSVVVEKVINAGEEVEKFMSEGQGIMWLLWSRQDVSRQQMERDGWNEDSFKQLDAFLSDEAKAIADFIAQDLQLAGDMIDPIYRRLFNAPMPRNRNYAPIYRMTPGDTAAMGMEQGMTSGLTAGFTKARVNNTLPLREMDAFVVFLSHWEHVSHWVSHAELMRDMKSVLLNNDVQNAIRAKAGKAGLENVNNRLKAIETAGNRTVWDMQSVNQFWSNLMKARAFKGLAFRISPIVKQTSAFLNPLLADVPAHAYAVGLANALGDPAGFSADVAMLWDSPIIKRRLEGGFSPEARIAMGRAGITGSTLVAAMQKGMAPMSVTDAGWTALGAAISFRYYKRIALREEGVTEEQANAIALKRVERMIATSAQPADLVNRALIENSTNPFVKSLWMFASESRKALAIELMAMRNLAKGKDIGMNTQRILVAHFVQAAVTQLMGSLLMQLMGDDEDRERAWSLDTWAVSLGLGPINGLFVFGSVIDTAVRRAMGMHTFANELLIAQAYKSVDKAVRNFDTLFDDDPENVMDWIDGMSAATGSVLSLMFGPAGASVDVFGNVARDARKIYNAQTED